MDGTSSAKASNDSEQARPVLAGLLFDVEQLPHEPQPKRKRALSRAPRQKRVPLSKQDKAQETMEDATSSADIASFFKSCE
jgi:hypothetical protein